MNSQLLKNYQTQNRPTPFNKAYFLSKSELLSWVSSILDLEITNIEQTSTGAIFCQLLDACHPGSIRMNKVNWKAKCETDYIQNFKIFQQGLMMNNINKTIDINRLANGKQNELNELLQWIYGYYFSIKNNNSIENYNAKKRRLGHNFIFKTNYNKKPKKKIIKDNYSHLSFSSNSDTNSQTDNYSTNIQNN